MNSIKFDRDWNAKITSSKIFSTIRKRTKYGHLKEGEIVSIYLNGKLISFAEVVAVREFCRMTGRHEIDETDIIAMLDTGEYTPDLAWDVLDNFLQEEDAIIIILRYRGLNF